MSVTKAHKRTFLSSPSPSVMKIKIKNGSVAKKRSVPKKIRKSQVIKTISNMDQDKAQQQPQTSANGSGSKGNPDDVKDEFYNTGRIGRRNAMPDILGSNCTASSGGDLPLKLSALTTNESSSSQQTNETPSQTTNK